ncbi:DMT family transporter [Conservatibacter flavescens]|uniref:EamA family transporter n=1 Tax=Conservatibacter flavescens TaxID=28161 RepID=A0A2M8S2T9_9PAST|nr:DMT family transporter [Conservatibacter flavescens]PJG85449.1 EamA family transporter [Conservatibacter flavescens]
MKQQPFVGFLLALITAMAWGSLPVALKQVLVSMNAQTVVFYRFLTAAIVLLILLGLSGKLPKLRQFNLYYGRLAIIGVLGLAGNFFFFSSSLKYIEPAVTQIFIHLSSFIMLICGVVFFKEKLGLHQKLGLMVLIIGLGLFFNERLAFLVELNQYALGVLLSIIAATVWVAYGIAQKLMLRQFNSQQILMMIYMGCALVFAPTASLSQVAALNHLGVICFIYCCANTLIGYGAYAEALNRWDVSKVSVVVTLVPLFTILFSHILHFFYPIYFANPELNMISYIGAFIVVLGAMLSAIGHKLFKKNSNI